MSAVDFLIQIFKSKSAIGIVKALVKKDATLKERLQAIPETIQAGLERMPPQEFKLHLMKYEHREEIEQVFQDVINRLKELMGGGLAAGIGSTVLTDQQVHALLDNPAVASMVIDNPFVEAGFMSPSGVVESMCQNGTISQDLVSDILTTVPIPPDIDPDNVLEAIAEVVKMLLGSG